MHKEKLWSTLAFCFQLFVVQKTLMWDQVPVSGRSIVMQKDSKITAAIANISWQKG